MSSLRFNESSAPAPTQQPGALGRRGCLQTLGGAGIGWLLRDLWMHSARASATPGMTAKKCILVWLDGGPSHLDTWDPKPTASAEIRGPFEAISTCIPGVFLSELFPRLAKRMDRCAIIRSMTSPLGEHNLGTHYLLTGHQPSPVLNHPNFFSAIQATDVIDRPPTLPPWVAVPEFQPGGTRLTLQGFLPPHFAPFEVGGNPADPQFRVPYLGNLDENSLRSLRRRQRYRGWMDTGENWQEHPADSLWRPSGGQFPDLLTDQAYRLLADSAAQEVLDLSREPEAVRNQYGTKTIGQSCLLARRLIEAGVPLVTVADSGWDTHNDLITRLKDGFVGSRTPQGLGPALDQGLSALIDDLSQRGLLDDTLIVVMGEFGRTPRTNAAGGRDHWPRVFSVLLAGGPIRGGAVYGQSDRHGESPSDSPVTPADLMATIVAAMGIDVDATLPTPDGRLHRIVAEQGRPIKPLLS